MESGKTRRLRWKFNWYPAYRRSSARVTYIAENLREVHIRLPLNWKTRNLYGSIYGGSIYAAVDPLHAVMLLRNLGPGYEAWTKEARIRFKRQARSDLTGRAAIDKIELEMLRQEIDRVGSAEREYSIDLVDAEGHVCATCDILVHLRASRCPANSSVAAFTR